MSEETFGLSLMGTILIVAFGYIAFDAFSRRRKKAMINTTDSVPLKIEELPQALPIDDSIHSLRLCTETMDKFSQLKAAGKQQEAKQLLASVISSADTLGLSAYDTRLLEKAYGLEVEGSAGLYKVVFVHLFNAIKVGDKDLLGTLLVSNEFQALSPDVKEQMIQPLLDHANRKQRQDLVALLTRAQQD